MARPERPFEPPRPAIPERELSWHRLLAVLRTNALEMWPARAYEEELLVQRFFGRQRLLLNTADGIKQVLVDNAANYRRSPATIRILRPIVGRGLFLSDGEDWKLQRRIIAPALAPRVIPLLSRHIAEVGRETLTRLAAMAAEPVDLLAVLQLLALEVAGRSMFSLEMARHGPALRRMIAEFGASLARPYLFDMLLPAWWPTLRDLARRRFQRRWAGLMDGIIEQRLRAPAAEAPRDLFDLLRAARDPETGKAFSPAELRDQVSTMIVAGHETTALALFWSLYLLASAPAIQDRLAEEAAAVEITPDSAGETPPRLPYARAVVSEALRLYPPAFLIVREAVGTDEHRGIAIPPGSLVLIAPWLLHRHRRLWRDPDAFDPARFLEPAPPPPRFTYLPFGAGPRVCVGAQFALAEATLILAMTIRRFRVARADAAPVRPVAVVTTQPDHPAMFRLAPR
ncbi:MAG TPA: cytochrome P450 [Dongiaceae bacterium]|nr:cytochrome P450 [Dongiaceae bacterium]